MTPQQVEAAALAAAAAAALPAPAPAATPNTRDGGLLPPSYDATAVPTSQQPSSLVVPDNNATSTTAYGEKSTSNNPFLSSSENSSRGSFVGAEKSAFGDEQDAGGEDTTIPDQASASSGSGSGTGPFSTPKPPSNGQKDTK
jgi:hypothetical protein